VSDAADEAPRALPVSAAGVEVLVVASREQAARLVADEIGALLRRRAAEGRRAVLGLASGRSPQETYAELVARHRAGAVSFAQAQVFALDEYWPVAPDDPGSFHQALAAALFEHVDLPADGVHLPDGSVDRDDVEAECEAYERAVVEAGGIDLQLLGIGRNGHLGFNEPGSPLAEQPIPWAVPGVEAATGSLGHGLPMGLGMALAAKSVGPFASGSAGRGTMRARWKPAFVSQPVNSPSSKPSQMWPIDC